jgi:hypothetical protein
VISRIGSFLGVIAIRSSLLQDLEVCGLEPFSWFPDDYNTGNTLSALNIHLFRRFVADMIGTVADVNVQIVEDKSGILLCKIPRCFGVHEVDTGSHCVRARRTTYEMYLTWLHSLHVV